MSRCYLRAPVMNMLGVKQYKHVNGISTLLIKTFKKPFFTMEKLDKKAWKKRWREGWMRTAQTQPFRYVRDTS